jgi:putative transposase
LCFQARLPDPAQTTQLKPFSNDVRVVDHDPLPGDFYHYLELVDWTGRSILPHKRGNMPQGILPILIRLNINAVQWLKGKHHSQRLFSG